MKSFPQAANPEPVYGMKKIMIITAAIPERIFFSSRCLFEKNSGTVVELPAISVYFLSLFATISQLK